MVFTVVLVAWVFSLCLHEFSHAAVAYLGGDHTVKEKGYLTFNPLKFTDPLLSIILPILFLAIGGLPLPGGCVYIDRSLLRSRLWDSAVSIAGPLANVIFAVLLATPFLFGFVDPRVDDVFWSTYAAIILLQVCAVFFNLLPLPPLDGYGVISPWFSDEVRSVTDNIGRHGILVLVAIFWFVDPVARGFWQAVFAATNLLGVSPDLAREGILAFIPF